MFALNSFLIYLIVQDDLENLPFPNDETEFNLPEEIFEASAKPHSSASESSAVADEGIFNVLVELIICICNV